MTEAAFRGWIRSSLRRMSQRWKPIYECKRRARRAVTAADREQWGNRLKWVFQCAICQHYFPEKFIDVDHIVPCGTLVDIEHDAGPFILRMLCEADGLRCLCRECHHVITQKERNEQARPQDSSST